MSKSNIVLNNVVLINNGRAADFLKWIHNSFHNTTKYSNFKFTTIYILTNIDIYAILSQCKI